MWSMFLFAKELGRKHHHVRSMDIFFACPGLRRYHFLSCVMTRSVSKNVFLLNIFGAVDFQASTWNGFVKSRFRTNRIYDGGCSICAIFYLKARPALRMHGECYQQRVGLWKMNARWKGHERKLMQFFKKHDRTWMAHDMRLRCNMKGHEWVQSEG